MKKRNAKTQIETIAILMTVIVITLSVVTFPRMARNSSNAKTKTCQANRAMMNTQLEVYYSENNSWPTDLKDITINSDYFPKGLPVCPSGGEYSINGNHRVSCSIHGH